MSSLSDSVIAKVGGIKNAFNASWQDIIDVLTEAVNGEKKAEAEAKKKGGKVETTAPEKETKE
jgi:hypothetical protein